MSKWLSIVCVNYIVILVILPYVQWSNHHLQHVINVLILLSIPRLGYLILPIYSFCNLHVVSWGTREVKKLTKEEKERMNSGETTDNRLSTWQWFQK